MPSTLSARRDPRPALAELHERVRRQGEIIAAQKDRTAGLAERVTSQDREGIRRMSRERVDAG